MLVRTARRISLLTAAAVSVMAGFGLIWAAMPDRIELLRTDHLIAIIGLFALPGIALVALELDRRSALRHSVSRRSAESTEPAPSADDLVQDRAHVKVEAVGRRIPPRLRTRVHRPINR